jgi:hypothetical protein
MRRATTPSPSSLQKSQRHRFRVRRGPRRALPGRAPTGIPLAPPAGHPQNLGVTEIVRRDELQAVIEARAELGAEMEPAVINAFVERLERRIAEDTAEREQALKRKRDHQKEMVLGTMGISVPLLAIAAIFTGLAGVLVVCGALVVIAFVSTR